MQTITWAVNRPFGELPGGMLAEGDSPTAWHLSPVQLTGKRVPPALVSEALI
ncbi:hypothetical protein LZ518_10775 [Sphingomonas sp. RB56-2]|uniref:Uncharacterized protein n=1 Tax=Sphingomonas brevis TaxID=2908206 RepID=A0ABT0SB23_9SPHN|nr:hypothetical protein [Sphingomonas brevis]MCL6741615.1 hypothetical protein [Sphingomonas brevis]